MMSYSVYGNFFELMSYCGSYIPPRITEPLPLTDTAIVSLALLGFSLYFRQTIKQKVDHTIEFASTTRLENKALKIFQKTFNFLKSNRYTHFFFKTVFYTPIVDLNGIVFVPPIGWYAVQLFQSKRNIPVSAFNFHKSVCCVGLLVGSTMLNASGKDLKL